MINPEENKEETISMLRARIIMKEKLMTFTETEIKELERTIEKIEKY